MGLVCSRLDARLICLMFYWYCLFDKVELKICDLEALDIAAEL